MTTAFQVDLWGVGHRLMSWKDILKEKLKKYWWLHSHLTDEEKNRLIIAETFVDWAEQRRLFSAIQSAPNIETAKQLMTAFLADKDTPSMETLTRQLRRCKEEMEEDGYDLARNQAGDNDTIENYDELLIEIDKATTERDSALENRFGVYLNSHIPSVRFCHNEVVTNGNGKTRLDIDFIARSHGIVVQVDGYEYHRDTHSFVRDRQIWRTLARWGYTILPFAGSELVIKHGFRNALDEIKWWVDKRS